MDYEKALRVLVQFNAWRRDNHIPNKYEQPNPTEVGQAIDLAITAISDIVVRNIWIDEMDEE